MQRKVTVQHNTLRFSAAHFATFAGQCEPLHGHNYDVIVEVEGELTQDAWVLDFVHLKELMHRLCHALDHRFLLPLRSPVLAITERAAAWEIAFRERRYIIPKSDVCPLPVDNSTAERLAEWLCLRLKEELA
ncbi:MAG: 6-pyruvoyl tetrahydropterin synthase family protein, partial [Dehalococcoidia bacterium]